MAAAATHQEAQPSTPAADSVKPDPSSAPVPRNPPAAATHPTPPTTTTTAIPPPPPTKKKLKTSATLMFGAAGVLPWPSAANAPALLDACVAADPAASPSTAEASQQLQRLGLCMGGGIQTATALRHMVCDCVLYFLYCAFLFVLLPCCHVVMTCAWSVCAPTTGECQLLYRRWRWTVGLQLPV